MTTAPRTPLEMLNLWADLPNFADIRKMLHPSSDDFDIAVYAAFPDDMICVGACIAMQRRRDLLLIGDDADRVRSALARILAVAECCAHVVEIQQIDGGCICRFVAPVTQ